MQKKLIALAVAGLVAAPAFAQSNVTLYGIVDAGLAYGKAGDTTFTGVQNANLSGNRFGFKGTEDLGNGLKAVFVLEHHFTVGDGKNFGGDQFQFQRQSWLGLQGGFGTVGLGRQYAPGYNYTAKFSAASAGNYDPQAILSGAIGSSINPGSAARWDNSVTYNAGNMGGVMAEAIYSFQTAQSGDDRTDDDKMGIGLGYAAGPLGVGFVWQKLNTAAGDDTKEYYLAGSYDLGMAKLIGSYQIQDLDGDVKNKVAYVGAIVPVGKGNVHVAFADLNKEGDDNDSRSFTLGYTHGLSKRTTGYVMVNRTTNEDNSAVGVLVKEAGEGSTALAVGVRHAF